MSAFPSSRRTMLADEGLATAEDTRGAAFGVGEIEGGESHSESTEGAGDGWAGSGGGDGGSDIWGSGRAGADRAAGLGCRHATAVGSQISMRM